MPNSNELTGGEIWVMGKLNELTLRLGLKPTQIELQLNCLGEPDYAYELDLCGLRTSQADDQKMAQLRQLLGLDKGRVEFEFLDDLNDIVDRALEVTPPPKTWSR